MRTLKILAKTSKEFANKLQKLFSQRSRFLELESSSSLGLRLSECSAEFSDVG